MSNILLKTKTCHNNSFIYIYFTLKNKRTSMSVGCNFLYTVPIDLQHVLLHKSLREGISKWNQHVNQLFQWFPYRAAMLASQWHLS